MSANPYNLVDDQELLDEYKQHFDLAIDALKEAVQRGEKTYFLNVLNDLEDIKLATRAVEEGKAAIVFEDGVEIPLQQILDEEIPPTPDTTCCSSCSSTDLKDVIVKPQNAVAKKCMHCDAVFEPVYFVGDIEVEDLE